MRVICIFFLQRQRLRQEQEVYQMNVYLYVMGLPEVAKQQQVNYDSLGLHTGQRGDSAHLPTFGGALTQPGLRHLQGGHLLVQRAGQIHDLQHLTGVLGNVHCDVVYP